jgi:sulfur carrier protein
MIEITVNGDRISVPADTTIEQLLTRLEIRTRGIAVEVNQQLRPRDQHATFRLSAEDQLEIVTLVGGG